MSPVDKDIERLIVRELDGQLSEDEQLKLNRELIRNPEAHRMMEEYRRIDELASRALEQALGDDRMTLDPTTLPSCAERRPARRFHRGWWLAPGAVAAALLAIVIARFPIAPSSDPTMVEREVGAPKKVVPVIPGAPGPEGLMRTVGTDGRRIRRDTGREVFGVLGDDGNIYWIEVDRTRTIERPARGPAVGYTTGEM
ncbi:MAG: hypothetical protein WBE26_13125 [Phycisphaerae bacterium]